MISKQDIDFSSLKAFLEVSQDCNMSAAAKRLGITQPAISSSIHKLEEALGTPLFDRTSRPISLTQAGRILQNRSAEILTSLEGLATEVMQSMHGVTPHLRIGTSDSISICCVPYMVQKLLPLTSSRSMYTFNTPAVCEMLLNKKIDIAIATDPLLKQKEVRALTLHQEDFLIVAPKKYEGKIKHMTDMLHLILQLPVIRFNDLSLDAIQIERVLRQCNVYSPHVIEADTNQTVLSLISQGCGWSVMPTLGLWAAKDFLTNVSIHKLHSLQAKRVAYVLYSSAYYEPIAEKVRLFVRETITNVVMPKMHQVNPMLVNSISIPE